MFKDFLVGTFGKLLQVVFVGIGILLIIFSGLLGSFGFVIVGVLFLCAAYGVHYAMGYIIKHRDH